MPRTACTFFNPVTNVTYAWPVNYLEQDGPARAKSVTYDAKASSLGNIGTEGDDGPLEINLSGTILNRSQLITFYEYYGLANSFRYTDEDGGQYEVTMVSFEPTKVRVRWNPRDVTMRMHKYTYKMKMRVLRIIAGDLLTAGVDV